MLFGIFVFFIVLCCIFVQQRKKKPEVQREIHPPTHTEITYLRSLCASLCNMYIHTHTHTHTHTLYILCKYIFLCINYKLRTLLSVRKQLKLRYLRSHYIARRDPL